MVRKTSKPSTILAVLAIVTIPALLSTNSSYAADFEKVGESINSQERLVAAITSEKDTFSQSLIEPLVQLAKLQRSANLFKEAQESIDQALQTTRIAYGLFDEAQLPLLRLDIENTIALTEWDNGKDKLDHYTWLLTDHIEQPLGSLVESLLWLVSIHEQGVFAATEADRVWHITRASMLSNALISLTQQNNLQDTRPHVQFLYALTKMYFLEAKAILAGGTTSYQLREVNAAVVNVESRASSQRRLYNSGLSTLFNIKAIMRNSDDFNAEAMALVDLRIADWKVLFGKADDISKTYGHVITALKQAGVSEKSISDLLQQPAPLPRASLTLSVAEEIYSIAASSVVPDKDDSLRLSLFEATSDIPGIILDQEPNPLTQQMHGDWGVVATELTLNPHIEVSVKNAGFSTKSRVTPKQTKLMASYGLEQKTLENVQARIAAISFRPAFVDGIPTVSRLTLDYRFRDAIWSDNKQLISLR